MPSQGVFAALLCLSSALAVLGQAGTVHALPPYGDIGRAECQNMTCGEVTIPYPFGIGNCSAPGFHLSCKQNEDGILKLFLGRVEVLNISLPLGQIKVMHHISSSCYNAESGRMEYNDWHWNLTGTPYVFSHIGNMFTVLGCRTLAYIGGSKNNANTYTSGCVTMWSPSYNEMDPTDDGSCSGMGCCQTAIPKGLKYYRVWFYPVLNTSDIYESCRCSYAVLMDSSNFRFSTQDLTTSEFNDTFDGRQPLVLEWAIGQDNCSVARTKEGFACDKSSNSECFDAATGRGYICNCTKGFQGNPYLRGADGCQDINECNYPKNYTCFGKCENKIGTFNCYCPSGTQGNASLEACQKVLTTGARLAIGEGAHGAVFKAILDVGGTATAVAVKRCKVIDKARTTEFVHELVILCQIRHPHVVKLLGCCLQFEAPMLVYEYVPNGDLEKLLHGSHRPRVTLATRLRIAKESAEALAHLHSPPHPIRHGDVKPDNILLGEGFIVKVSDFGCSTIDDNTQVVPKGTFGYLDPEFILNNHLTDKNDVYSFGVVLLELLTGMKPLVKERKNLTVIFQNSRRDGTVHEILDPDIVDEGSREVIHQAAELASQCIAVPGESRPAMELVAAELRRLVDLVPECLTASTSPKVLRLTNMETRTSSRYITTQIETTELAIMNEEPR
ncbi:hypothetical protein EJB05_55120, partial [Eragrostis curvula]